MDLHRSHAMVKPLRWAPDRESGGEDQSFSPFREKIFGHNMYAYVLVVKHFESCVLETRTIVGVDLKE
jgi:hypothetical protein